MTSRGCSTLLLTLVLACSGTGEDEGPKEEQTKKAVEPASKATGPGPENKHALERERLDASVWEAEVAAQEYEQTFVALWDAMRQAGDPSEPLSKFEFAELVLPELSEAKVLAPGVEHRGPRPETATLSPSDWSETIQNLRGQGWVLEQSEWHHSSFVPGDPARSLVSFLLHARSESPPIWVAIEGKLAVTWTKELRDGHHVPGRIEVEELSVTERSGKPVFSRARTFEPVPANSRDPHVQPVLVYDLDQDGLSEVVLAGANRVYWNRGDMKFEDGPLVDQPVGYLSEAAFGDLDGDGHVDLLAAVGGAPPLFYKGDAGGKFTEQARELAALPSPLLNPLALTLGDIDGDGDLDAFITQYKRPYVMGQFPTPYYDANDGFAAYLLLNDGKGIFTDATKDSGLELKRYRRTYSTSLLDLDEDGDLDLLVVSDFSGVDVYQNDGKGKFTDMTKEWVDERASFGMSFTTGDYDLDGRRDLYVVGMSSTTARRLDQLKLGREEFSAHQDMRMKMAYGNRMYVGRPDGGFAAAPFADAVARTGWSWGSTSFDFDRDGDLDIYIGNGNVSRGSATDYCTTFWRHDIYTGNSELNQELGDFYTSQFDDSIASNVSWNGYEHNKLFVNDAGKGFHELGYPLGAALEEDARGIVSDDLDGDGRVDLVVVLSRSVKAPRGEVFHETVAILRNEWPGEEHWLGVRLGGKRSPVGARIRTSVGGKVQEHTVMVGDSLQAQHAPARLFGLGESSKADWFEVEWADGHKKRVSAPAIDRWHVVSK